MGDEQSSEQSSNDIDNKEYEEGLSTSLNIIILTMFLSSMGFTIIIPSLWLYFSHFDECKCSAPAVLNLTLANSFDYAPAADRGGEEVWLDFGSVRAVMRDGVANNSNMRNNTSNSSKLGELPSCIPSIIKQFERDFDESSGCHARKSCNAFSGLIVSAFPLAQLLSSPVIGYLGAKRGARPLISATLAIMACGYICYSVSKNRWALFASRFLMGLGAGNVSVLRYYASGATSEMHRTLIMAKMSGAQSLGFVLGPGIGYGLAILLGKDEFDLFGSPHLRLDAYTAPGYLAAGACCINAILVWYLVIEIMEPPATPHGPPVNPGAGWSPGSEESPSSSRGASGLRGSLGQAVEGENNQELGRGRATYDSKSFLVLITLFSTLVLVFSVYEGVGTQISECALGWEVEANGLFLCTMGVVAVVSMLCLRKVEAMVGDRELMLGAYCMLLVSLFCFIDFSPPLPMWQWVLGGIMLSGSFPVSQAMAYVLFSKTVPRRKQGLLMGYLTSAGSLARMVGPPLATSTYSAGGFRTYPIFAGAAVFMLVGLGMTLYLWDSLAPRLGAKAVYSTGTEEEGKGLLDAEESDDSEEQVLSPRRSPRKMTSTLAMGSGREAQSRQHG